MQVSNNIQDLNCAFQKYFRSSKRIRIHNRSGDFIVVDDRKEAVDLIKKLFDAKSQKSNIVSSNNVEDAKSKIIERENGKKVKAVVIDLGLEGEGKNADGVYLAQWLHQNYPDIPFLFSTGREKRVKELTKEFPGVDIFVKGKDNLNDLSEALGLNIEEDSEDSYRIPTDFVDVSQIKDPSKNVLSFIKKFLAL